VGTTRLFALVLVAVILGVAFLTQSDAQVTTATYNLTVEIGQVGQVRLPVNVSTGCSWWVESAPSSVDISTSNGTDPTVDCGNPPRAGCSNAVVVYSFKPNMAGNFTIELRYGHSWAHSEYYEIAIVHLSVLSLTTAVIQGTIHSGVEAGCWLIQVDYSNTEYLLLDTPDALRVNGLHVQITGTIRTDIASYCMQGDGALEIISYSIMSSWTTSSSSESCTSTMTVTLTSGLPIPPLAPPLTGSCYDFVTVPPTVSPSPIVKALTDFWNWLQCLFGYCPT
jgi:hypothetical protein